MNRLALCKRLRQEANIAGTGPVTTIGQTGELASLVDWIDAAYEEIQDKRQDWNFLRNDFNFNCTIGVSVYPSSTVANMGNWKKDSLRIYLTTVNDEQWLSYVPWDEFRDYRLKGSNRTATGRPIDFSIKPDKSLVFWPIPDSAYTIDGEFYRNAHVMISDTDSPLFDRFNLVIVWNALMKYAAFQAEPSLYAHAQKEYGLLIGKLEADRAPAIVAGQALA